MPAQIEANLCTPATGAQQRREMAGDATTTTEPFGLRAAWLHFANQIEIRRLAKLHVRIERKKAALAELVDERHTIMRRCIRRMRRAGGKH
ncbi:hypothetical protein [Parasedimentitalea psychrophila]|uniref:Uncharacterized protein n=1 Tax=Parasedimentitalea psychrophila TaxID=2997337 RepID=A0A9Y2P3B8_9RHOB|nr:hypothetical protein [Parasedimentitalea psychrophila]WIY27511.1 hypothetical protein QPJ95_11700 [Parasedimentitalea psychrophila]